MYRDKKIKVVLVGDAKQEYIKLNKVVGQDISNGIKGSEHQTLLKSIKQKLELLRDNPEYGIHISKSKTPKEYIKRYDINNLWKVNLSGAWR